MSVATSNRKLIEERQAEDARMASCEVCKEKVVTRVMYGYDSNKDWIVAVKSGHDANMNYAIVVKIRNSPRLTCSEARVICESLKLTIRGKKFDFQVVSTNLSALGAIVLQNTSTLSRITITPSQSESQFGAMISLEKDEHNFCFGRKTASSLYAIKISHPVSRGSYPSLCCQALIHCLGLALDIQVTERQFLDYCRQLRAQYKILEIRRERPNVYRVEVVPTKLSCQEAGIIVEDNINLSLPKGLNQSFSSSEDATRDLLLQMLTGGLGSAPQRRPVQSPLVVERKREEAIAAQDKENKRPCIVSTKYEFVDKFFTITVKCGSIATETSTIRIRVSNADDISFTECRAIRALLTRCGRGCDFHEASLSSWCQLFNMNGYRALLASPGRVLEVQPATQQRHSFGAGKCIKLGVKEDSDGDFRILLTTDEKTYCLIVTHKVENGSYGKLQIECFISVLAVAEPGEKMDDEIFLQHCARLKEKYSIVSVSNQRSMLVVVVLPSGLTPKQAEVNLQSMPLPAVTSGTPEWSTRTKQRVESIAQANKNQIAEQKRARALSLAKTLFDEKKYMEAAGQYSIVISLADTLSLPREDLISLHNNRSANYDRAGAYDHALADISAVLKLDSSHEKSLKRRASIREKLSSSSTPLRPPVTAPTITPDLSLPAADEVLSEKGADTLVETESQSSLLMIANDLPRYEGIRTMALLKESGQANVYTGMMAIPNSSSETEVAIKVYHTNSGHRDFSNELASLQSLPVHLNVINILRFFEKPRPTLVMPLIHGVDLRQHLSSKGVMETSNSLRVLRGIATGLSHLHSHHVVHRDMKSANVLIESESFRPILIDLGFGKMTDDVSLQTTQTKGTSLWMAPEMMDGKSNFKGDIYALGIIMWEVFSGQVPYSETDLKTPMALYHHVFSERKRPNLSCVQSSLGMSPMRLSLMQRCWSHDPNDRPTSEGFIVELDRSEDIEVTFTESRGDDVLPLLVSTTLVLESSSEASSVDSSSAHGPLSTEQAAELKTLMDTEEAWRIRNTFLALRDEYTTAMKSSSPRKNQVKEKKTTFEQQHPNCKSDPSITHADFVLRAQKLMTELRQLIGLLMNEDRESEAEQCAGVLDSLNGLLLGGRTLSSSSSFRSLSSDSMSSSTTITTFNALEYVEGSSYGLNSTEEIISGRIYRANSSLLKTRVVLKFSKDGEDLSHEANILTLLGDTKDAKINLYHFDERSSIPYLILEDFGCSLTEYFRESSHYKVPITKQLLAGLAWIHSKNIVHCDIKPQNILVFDMKGELQGVKFCDFDSATELGHPFPSGMDLSEKKTLKISKNWVAPEVYFHNPNDGDLAVNVYIDYFSIALVIACLLDENTCASMTLLPSNDEALKKALTDPSHLDSKIVCGSEPQFRPIILQLSTLSPPSCRGTLIQASIAADQLTRTALKKQNQLYETKVGDHHREVVDRLKDIQSSLGALMGAIKNEFGQLGAAFSSTMTSLSVLECLQSESFQKLSSLEYQLKDKITPLLEAAQSSTELDHALDMFKSAVREQFEEQDVKLSGSLSSLSTMIDRLKSSQGSVGGLSESDVKRIVDALTPEMKQLQEGVANILNVTQNLESQQKKLHYEFLFKLPRDVYLGSKSRNESLEAINQLREELKGLRAKDSLSISKEELIQSIQFAVEKSTSSGLSGAKEALEGCVNALQIQGQSFSGMGITETVLSTLKDFIGKLDSVSDEISSIRTDITDIKRTVHLHTKMITDIILGTARVPCLVWIVPDVPSTLLEQFSSCIMVLLSLISIIYTTLYIYFI